MKKYIIFNFICMYFVYFEIIILINLYYFLITLYNYYKNKCESVLYFYTIKNWKKNNFVIYFYLQI